MCKTRSRRRLAAETAQRGANRETRPPTPTLLCCARARTFVGSATRLRGKFLHEHAQKVELVIAIRTQVGIILTVRQPFGLADLRGESQYRVGEVVGRMGVRLCSSILTCKALARNTLGRHPFSFRGTASQGCPEHAGDDQGTRCRGNPT